MTELLRIINVPAEVSTRELRSLVPRAHDSLDRARSSVAPVVEDVRARGRAAVLEATSRFDGVTVEQIRVPHEELARACDELDSRVRAALEESIARLRQVSARDVPQGSTTEFDGSFVSTRWTPVDRVGLYVPGGRAVYPSTVVMNAVPAQVAGVESLALASPPGPSGLPHPVVMATAELLGVEEVWAMGGAQAIAAFAYGFDDGEVCEPVDVITGPGNAYVAGAKSLVRSFVGVDSIAGPTEIIVCADAQAKPELVATDLISQAEHDPLAASVLVTASADLVTRVQDELARQLETAKHRERIREAFAGPQSGILLVDSRSDMVRVANVYAGEHVEVMVEDPHEFARELRHGGTIFIGDYSPVALGDYCSGSNHVLPTSGTATHASPLGVHSFMKSSQIVSYTRDGLLDVADHIETLANAENLPAHGYAVHLRRES
ncbi:histidinol dehydrogenase [Brevibacterium mcbrellneri]|uniref:histidinol dehydrogenase n=1 Tax=Brevibacterium mcbrellneri TaxID=53363 RepID=UPI0002ECBCEF|nr:histidinol dehydrogenase [Brevibacterium mcbrellneri]